MTYNKNEIKQLDKIALGFIGSIKREKMTKSYKIPTLLAFYNKGNIKLKITYDDIYNSFNEYYEIPKHKTEIKDIQNWSKEECINKIKETSMKHLSKEYFYEDKLAKLFCIVDDIEKYITDLKFIEEFFNEIEFLENKYFRVNYKLGFKEWLTSEVKEGSVNAYVSGVNSGSEKFFKDKDYLYCLDDVGILTKNIDELIKSEEFEMMDKKAHRRISNGLKQYIKYRNSILNKNEKYEDIKNNSNKEENTMEINRIVIHTQNYIKNQGYNYTYNQLSNLYLSLKTKPFTILAGISGTGKSKIIRLLADSLGADYTLISVKPDWNDATDLIGYKNLDDKFIKGQLTKTILKAQQNKNKIYFICLDEMNLARVEYYLSDYLSTIESRKKLGQDIITDNIIEYEENNETINLHIPDNIYLIGTVNMDDTTFQFSRKVLDRANTIEFSDVDLDSLFLENDNEEIEPLNISHDFLKTTYLKTMDIEQEYREYAKEINKNIIEINNILKKSQKQFAYRVRDEILFYMVENKKADLLDEDIAFDYQIMQKILPAITGSEQSVYEVLIDLFNFICETNSIDSIEEASEYLLNNNVRYENSANKIIYMLKGYQNDGYVSYWY